MPGCVGVGDESHVSRVDPESLEQCAVVVVQAQVERLLSQLRAFPVQVDNLLITVKLSSQEKACNFKVFYTVLGIRIRFRMFLDLPDLDPLVRGMESDPDPSLFS
jgi:hypothetical protein